MEYILEGIIGECVDNVATFAENFPDASIETTEALIDNNVYEMVPESHLRLMQIAAQEPGLFFERDENGVSAGMIIKKLIAKRLRDAMNNEAFEYEEVA